jgi:hypothetical protein
MALWGFLMGLSHVTFLWSAAAVRVDILVRAAAVQAAFLHLLLNRFQLIKTLQLAAVVLFHLSQV